MVQAEEIRDILRLQDELVRHRTLWDADPWLKLDMSTLQLKVLLLISEEEGIRMRELARRLDGSFSNATVLVDRLVDRGLVERLADPQDRRVVLVRAADEGQQLIDQLVTSWRTLSTPLLESLAPKTSLRCTRRSACYSRRLDGIGRPSIGPSGACRARPRPASHVSLTKMWSLLWRLPSRENPTESARANPSS